jgi:hypothetical protein
MLKIVFVSVVQNSYWETLVIHLVKKVVALCTIQWFITAACRRTLSRVRRMKSNAKTMQSVAAKLTFNRLNVYNYYSNKMHSLFIIKSTRYYNLYFFVLYFCTYMFQPAWVIFRGLNASVWLKLLLITIY